MYKRKLNCDCEAMASSFGFLLTEDHLSHYLLTIMLSCMTFFLLWNVKEDILVNVFDSVLMEVSGNQNVYSQHSSIFF